MDNLAKFKPLIPSPYQEVKFRYSGQVCRLYIKRDDLIHFFAGGNKWRKLMGHPIFKEQQESVHVLSTGGNHSNLVFALCWICDLYNYSLTILSPETEKDTYLIAWAKNLGVQFIGLNRTQLRAIRNGMQNPLDFIPDGKDVVWIPEGGSGLWSEEGISLMIEEIQDFCGNVPATILTAAGTGISSFYMLKSLPHNWELGVFPAIKSNSFNRFLSSELEKHQQRPSQYMLIPQDDDRGIGSVTDSLIDFLLAVYDQTGVLLDPFYNGKALYYFWKNGGFENSDKKIILIHSGGNQAWYGLSFKYPLNKRIQMLAEVFISEFKRL